MTHSAPERAQRVGIVGGGRAGLSLAIALVAKLGDDVEVTVWIRDPVRAAAARAWLRATRLAIIVVAGPAPAASCSAVADGASAGVATGTDTVVFPVDSARDSARDSAGDLGQAEVWSALDVAVFAVPDREIASAVRAGAVAGWLGPELCVLHLSGAAPIEALTVAGHRRVAAMHPLAALRDPLLVMPSSAAVEQVVATLCSATFGLAGEADALAIAASWLDRWQAARIVLAPEARVLWHAAAALIANDLVALLALGESLVQDAGVDLALARPAQLHLARTALDAVGAETAGGAPIWHGLTGAVRRGDADTLARHVAVMEAAGAHVAAAQHRSLSAVLVEILSRQQALPADRIQAMRGVVATDADEPSP